MSEVYKKAVYCILVLCFTTNVGKAQSNIARRLEILEHKFAIQAHENELMKEELNSIKLRLSEVENCTMLVDLEIPKKSTDVKCCTENEQKTLMDNAAASQQRDQQMALLRKGFRAEKQVREESAVSLQNKMANLSTELETLKSYIKQNLEDSAILKRVTTSEKALQEITAISKGLNQTVHEDVLIKIKRMESSFDGLEGKVTQTIHLVDQSLDSIKDLTHQEIAKLTNYQLNHHVAFSARLSQSVPNLDPWATLVFDQLIYNAGNSYSSQTGVFTAPRNGVYVFFTHILGKDRSLEMIMQKNGQHVLYLFVDDSEYYGSTSNMVVLDLQKGDRINVVKFGPWGEQPFYVHNKYSTFSGYILYPV